MGIKLRQLKGTDHKRIQIIIIGAMKKKRWKSNDSESNSDSGAHIDRLVGRYKMICGNFHIWSIFARYIAFIHPQLRPQIARWFDMHTDFRHSIAPNETLFTDIFKTFFCWSWTTATTTRTSFTQRPNNKQKKTRNSDVIRWMDEVQVMAVNARATSLYYEIFCFIKCFLAKYIKKTHTHTPTTMWTDRFGEAQCRKMAKQRYHIWVVFSYSYWHRCVFSSSFSSETLSSVWQTYFRFVVDEK